MFALISETILSHKITNEPKNMLRQRKITFIYSLISTKIDIYNIYDDFYNVFAQINYIHINIYIFDAVIA